MTPGVQPSSRSGRDRPPRHGRYGRRVSTPPSVDLPDLAERVRVRGAHGPLVGIEAQLPDGVPERTPVLLVPGFTGSKEDFLAILEPLAVAGHRALALDLRGQHESPHASDPSAYAFEALAEDLLAVAKAFGDGGPVHLVGHSLGGILARTAVLAEPGAWASVVLMGSGPAAIPGLRAERLRMLLDALPVMDLAAIWGIARELDAEAGITIPDGEVGAFLQARWHSNCPNGLAAMGEQLLVEPDRTESLRVSGVPALVLFGEDDDAWPPAVQEEMARALGAPAVRIAGSAHSPAAERPEETAAALLAWWDVLPACEDVALG